MGYNTQFPSWIIESSIANQQLGQQMGRNMLEGMKFQEQKRQYEQQRAERKPLLDAQTELAQAQLTSQLIDNQKNKTLLNLDNQNKAYMTDAFKLEEGINRSEGGWTSPENKAAFIGFLSRYPSLGDGKWAEKMRKQFTDAEKYQAELNQITTQGEQMRKTKEESAYMTISAPGLGSIGGNAQQVREFLKQNPELEEAVTGKSRANSPFKTVISQDVFGNPVYKVEFRGDVTPEQQMEILKRFQMQGEGKTPPPPGGPMTTQPGQETISVNGFTIRAK